MSRKCLCKRPIIIPLFQIDNDDDDDDDDDRSSSIVSAEQVMKAIYFDCPNLIFPMPSFAYGSQTPFWQTTVSLC